MVMFSVPHFALRRDILLMIVRDTAWLSERDEHTLMFSTVSLANQSGGLHL